MEKRWVLTYSYRPLKAPPETRVNLLGAAHERLGFCQGSEIYNIDEAKNGKMMGLWDDPPQSCCSESQGDKAV